MSKKDESFSEREIAKRRDDALRRALKTPPMRTSELKGKRLRSSLARKSKKSCKA